MIIIIFVLISSWNVLSYELVDLILVLSVLLISTDIRWQMDRPCIEPQLSTILVLLVPIVLIHTELTIHLKTNLMWPNDRLTLGH